MGVRPVGPAAVWVWCVDPTAKAVGFGYAARHAAGLETGTGTGSGTVSGVGANDNSPFLPPQTRSVIPQRRRGYPSTGELSEARDTLRGIGIPSRAESVAARMGPGPVRDRVPRGRVPVGANNIRPSRPASEASPTASDKGREILNHSGDGFQRRGE